MWERNLDALAADREVITWDMRGHARSDYARGLRRTTGWSGASRTCGRCSTSATPPARCSAGCRSGGYLSLAFHARHPERVAALILVDTGPGFRSEEPRREWNEFAERTAAALERDGLAALSASPEVGEHRDAGGLAHTARRVMAQHDAHVIDSLAQIAVPTLVVVGALDTNFLAAADYMAAKIPGARKVVLEGAGHAANIDAAEAFNAVVRRVPGGDLSDVTVGGRRCARRDRGDPSAASQLLRRGAHPRARGRLRGARRRRAAAARSCCARRASTSARGRTSARRRAPPRSHAPSIARRCACSRRRRRWWPRVQGAAVGGGLGLALSADFRVASPGSRFSANFSRLGFHHGFGLSVTLPALAGQQTALDLLLTGRRVHGEEALALGLCDRLVEDDEVRSAAHALAAELALSAPLAVRSIRATLRAGLLERVEAALEREASEQDRLRDTDDFREGVSASLERRAPRFEGR